MKHSLKRLLSLTFICLFCVSPLLYAKSIRTAHAPRLIKPDDKLDLNGKGSVTFEWSYEGNTLRREYYDLKVYNGANHMVQSNLIFHVHTKSNRVEVKRDFFKEDQAYTWSVREVCVGGDKSIESVGYFKTFRNAKAVV